MVYQHNVQAIQKTLRCLQHIYNKVKGTYDRITLVKGLKK